MPTGLYSSRPSAFPVSVMCCSDHQNQKHRHRQNSCTHARTHARTLAASSHRCPQTAVSTSRPCCNLQTLPTIFRRGNHLQTLPPPPNLAHHLLRTLLATSSTRHCRCLQILLPPPGPATRREPAPTLMTYTLVAHALMAHGFDDTRRDGKASPASTGRSSTTFPDQHLQHTLHHSHHFHHL
jgi:hypothetical protein